MSGKLVQAVTKGAILVSDERLDVHDPAAAIDGGLALWKLGEAISDITDEAYYITHRPPAPRGRLGASQWVVRARWTSKLIQYEALGFGPGLGPAADDCRLRLRAP